MTRHKRMRPRNMVGSLIAGLGLRMMDRPTRQFVAQALADRVDTVWAEAEAKDMMQAASTFSEDAQ